MFVKQLSIFIENKSGRLLQIVKILKDNNIDMRALSIADTNDFGILRIIVNDYNKAYQVLKENNCTVTLTDVIAVKVDDKPGGLLSVLSILYENNINLEYSYAFIGRLEGNALVILRVDDTSSALNVLESNNIKTFSESDISNY